MEGGEALAAMTLFLSVGAILVLRGPLGKAIAERIAGRHPGERGGEATGRSDDHADLLDQVARDLEDVKHRLGEVEERQDFAERLIARQADAARADAPARER